MSQKHPRQTFGVELRYHPDDRGSRRPFRNKRNSLGGTENTWKLQWPQTYLWMALMKTTYFQTRRIGGRQVEILHIDAQMQLPLARRGSPDDRNLPWFALAVQPGGLRIEKNQRHPDIFSRATPWARTYRRVCVRNAALVAMRLPLSASSDAR